MDILLLRTWLTNIGNGFIEKGARIAIERAFPDANIIEISGFSNVINTRIENRYRNLIQNTLSLLPGGSAFSPEVRIPNKNTSNADLLDIDVAVLPGCVLYPHALEPYRPVLSDFQDRDIPIVLLGAGGGNYTSETQQYVQKVLDDANIDVLLTRDKKAYNCYRDHVEFSYDGIDCAFYINEWYTPPEANREFVAVTFDKSTEPEIDTELEIRRADHAPWGKPYGSLSQLFGKRNNSNPQLRSDLLEDYLFIYANAELTVADRIHACVPALTYGNQVRYQYDTPRAALFEKLFDENIIAETVSIDRARLSKLKQQQVNALRKGINGIVY